MYAITGAMFTKYKFKYIHESGFAILLGGLLGAYLFIFEYPKSDIDEISFDDHLFFQYILPPIIFAGGYNLKKKKFFENFHFISLFGILGTIVNFGLMAGMVIFIDRMDWITLNNAKGQSIIVHLTTEEILLFSATLCASDAVAALTMVKFEESPRLFSVIFGEGIVNDAIAIILFETVKKLLESNEEFTYSTPFKMIG